ncbi:hypothetical protein HOLDEFILI_00162 [Holdemania filiformis DSM 12042]|uniref:Uncharacterized protein n=1 Tax=Holdemania filiformis DSM 12042 TaxID=545696 RepID=B9Y2Y7_9FIRM|nr:hypothetical protein HOLDEFILI_00162 [Holdemania filiformis DSM 12042]
MSFPDRQSGAEMENNFHCGMDFESFLEDKKCSRSVELRRILSCFYTFVRNNAKMKAITFLLAERG